MNPCYRLFGMPGSLYTAKARSYLRKQRLDVEELPVGHPDFAAIARQVGRFIMPVVEAPDGAIIQDTTAIIDHVERSGAV
ncbi:MAG: glutathione S-transferase N-terminal domain-containing protein, partial [Sphingomonas sp.]